MQIPDYLAPMPDYFDGPDHGPAFFDIDFTYDRPPLTSNQRLHWRAKASVTAGVRETTRFLARRIPYLERCDVTLTWFVTDRRRRDADNVVPTLKAMCDGLVDAGVVDDDTPMFMTKHMPVIEQAATASMRLRVAPLAPEAVAA